MKNSLRTYFKNTWLVIGFVFIVLTLESSAIRNNARRADMKNSEIQKLNAKAVNELKQRFENHKHHWFSGKVK